MGFWQAYKSAAVTLLAVCLWIYFLVVVNEVFVDNLNGYLQGLAFAVWNPLWIALAIAFCYNGSNNKDKDKPDEELTDEEWHWREYDH
jgi:uncharacterized membrane-anchored protein